MTIAFVFKIAVMILLFAIFISLTLGMVFLVQDKGSTQRTVTSLTVRIVLSLLLFALLIVGFATGMIRPHGIYPSQHDKAAPAQTAP
jgi:hypothetical protein